MIRQAFWAKQAESLHWFEKWNTVLDWSNAPHAQWFVGGKTNVSFNCLDRHADGDRKRQARHPLGRGTGRHANTHLFRTPR